MIPLNIDIPSILADLQTWGWTNHKIELASGLPKNYVSQLKNGSIQNPLYQNAALLYNFWCSERELRVAIAETTT